jgi:catechol 2,3-dioxygenase-like lactoylglutathione lyase family enzyme
MKPRITVITIGVDDLEESLRFYRDGLGLQTQGIIGKEFEYGAVGRIQGDHAQRYRRDSPEHVSMRTVS